MSSEPRPYTLAAMQPPSERRAQWHRIPGVTWEALRLVWSASRRHLVASAVLQLVAAAAVGTQLLVGKELLSKLITVSGSGGRLTSILPAFALLIAVTVVGGVVSALSTHVQKLLTELVARHTFDRIIGVSAAVPLDAFETPAFYDQLSRARTSGMYRPIEIVTNVTMLTMSVLTSLGVAVALATLAPVLLPLVAAASVPLLIASLHNSRQAYTFEYALTPQSRERAYLMDLLTSRDTAKEIRVFGATQFLGGRYDGLTDERISRLHEYLRRRLKVSLLGTVATAAGTAVALGSVGYLLARGHIDVATAVAAGMALQLLASRLATITGALSKLVEASMFLDDFGTFLELGETFAEPEPDTPAALAAPRPPGPFRGIELEGVSFTYPGTERSVLQDIDLRVDPGEVIALVGENGSGKTTLVKLICQLYRPHAGRIVWNGVDAALLSPEALRSDMTVIFQDYIQYHLSARDNVALGRVEREPLEAAIAAAARQAGADAFLSRLPDGYDTRLGRQFYGGHELSVGQWQRLALARAFFRGGDFLVLDEPTASLDPRAEHDLFNQMRALSQGRSVLLVSHRFSSVRTADRIYVMQEGRITEHGSHAELMALGGHYAELFELQASAYLGGERQTERSPAALA